MAAESLEERIARVEKMAQRALDYQEVANLMGRQVFKHECGMDPEFPDTLFAQKTPGRSWEVAFMGKYVEDGIRKPLSKHTDYPIGTMFEHNLASPVIEIAGDGKTAKGVWMSPGHETAADRETGKLKGHWCWSKYGCDFVKEDGKWKLWHYHVYRVFRTPFDTDWVDGGCWSYNPVGTTVMEDKFGKPDIPTTYDHPYSPTTKPELVPEPPEPYETFDPAKAY
jgi:hypothetical protein